MTMVLTDGGSTVLKFPYTEYMLREENPNTSFPAGVSMEMLASYNVYPVVVAPAPDFDPWTHELMVDEQPKLVDGAWTLGHSVREKTQEEMAEWAQAASDTRRARRNSALSDSDWTQLPDSPLSSEQKAAWAAYRASLRDLTTHPSWPRIEEADWPVKPE